MLIGCVLVVKQSNAQIVACKRVVAQVISYPERNDVAECGDVLFLRSGLTNLPRALTTHHLPCHYSTVALRAEGQSH